MICVFLSKGQVSIEPSLGATCSSGQLTIESIKISSTDIKYNSTEDLIGEGEKATVSCKNDFENNKIIGDGKNELSRSKLLACNEILVNIFAFEYFSAKTYFIK